MELVVLNVAYPFAPVGRDVLGAPELALAQLDSALVHAGHESFVMACEGSSSEGILLATPKVIDPNDALEKHRIYEQYRFTLRSFLEKWPIDLIHMHGADFYEYLPPAGVPVLVTLHLPVDQYPESIFRIDRPQTFFQCVSAEQLNACPPCANVLTDDPVSESSFLDFSSANRSAMPASVEKYLMLYERLVNEARILEAFTAAADKQAPEAMVHL